MPDVRLAPALQFHPPVLHHAVLPAGADSDLHRSHGLEGLANRLDRQLIDIRPHDAVAVARVHQQAGRVDLELALHLADHFADSLGTFDFVISGLPLVLFTPEQRRELLAQVFKVLKPSGVLHQFTYAGRSPIDRYLRNDLGIQQKLIGIAALYLAMTSVAGYRHWSRHHRDFVRDILPELRKALEDGRVAVKQVAASAVIEIEEFEDEGQGYLFDVGGGNVLFLKGQLYYAENQYAEGGGDPWPNTRFDIVRTLHGNHWLGIFCQGDPLEPTRTIAAEDQREEYVWDEREEVRHGTLDEVARAICCPTSTSIVSKT